MPTYFALLSKDRSHYVVTFPDFPDCEASGASIEDVYGAAAQVLRTHVRQMVEHGESLPEPCDRNAINEIPSANLGLLLRVDVEAPNRT